MFIRLPGAKLETEVQVQRIFDAIRRFWVRECAGAKVYCVVDYTDFSLNIALTAAWAAGVQHAVETYTIATVRYCTDISARATVRAVAIKTHQPSNLYATREDALSVVNGLRAKRIELGRE
jgi:hypothetical protein